MTVQLTRRRLLGAVAGATASLAGCGGTSRPISFNFVNAKATLTGIEVRSSFSSRADRDVTAIVKTTATVGDGDTSYSDSKMTTLPSNSNTEVTFLLEPQKNAASIEGDIMVEVSATFPNDDREKLGPRECSRCPI